MGVAKVTLNGDTLIDVTQKTVKANTLLSGETALDWAGEGVTGNIASKSSSDLTVSGSTVTVPAGYYATQATKNIASASAFPPAIGLTSSTGVITGTNTFAAGYYAASTSTSTLQLTSKAAATYYTSTADQTISSYRWLTGAQTIKSVTYTGLTASNIASGVTVKIGDSGNASRIAQVTGTHQGGTPHTATLTYTGDTTHCYIQYKGTKYYTSGDTFTFIEGDTITLYTQSPYGAEILIGAKTVDSTSGSSALSYSYSAPGSDLEIALDYWSGNTTSAHIYVDVLDFLLEYAGPITPTTSLQYITPSIYYGLAEVQVSGDSNLVASNIASGISIFGVMGTHQGGIIPSGTSTITANGTYDITTYASAIVSLPDGNGVYY